MIQTWRFLCALYTTQPIMAMPNLLKLPQMAWNEIQSWNENVHRQMQTVSSQLKKVSSHAVTSSTDSSLKYTFCVKVKWLEPQCGWESATKHL